MHWILLITLIRPVGATIEETPPIPYTRDGQVVVYETQARCHEAVPDVKALFQRVEGSDVRVMVDCKAAN